MLVIFCMSLYSFLLDHLYFQDTFETRRRSLVYNPLILLSSDLLIVQVSLPYNKMVSMVTLTIIIFSILARFDFQSIFIVWYAFQASALRNSKSLCELLIHDSRYLKLSTIVICEFNVVHILTRFV